MIYYLTNRDIVGRYVVPANFLFAILLGLFIMPFYNNVLLPIFVKRWKFFLIGSIIFIIYPFQGITQTLFNTLLIAIIGGFIIIFYRFWRDKFVKYSKDISILVALFVLIFPPIDKKVLNYSAQNRTDQLAWRSLIERVKTEAPIGSHVVLKFKEPFMIETAQSLEANTLLSGRYDLTYHLLIEDTSNYKRDSGFIKYLVNSFNIGRKELVDREGENILYVKADREGGEKNRAPLSFSELMKLLIKSPNEFFYYRYYSDKTPYLNYKISLNQPI
jgi:hypothetical protein